MSNEFLPLILAATLSVHLRLAAGTWAHPAPLISGTWSFFLSIPVLTLTNISSFSSGAWIIFGLILASSCSIGIRPNGKLLTRNALYSSRVLSIFVVLGSLCAALSALITQRANGISISSLFSNEDVSNAARTLTVLRYDGTLTTPVVATLLLAFSYAAAFVAPFAATRHKGTIRLLILCGPSIGGALYAFLTTARSGLLISAALTIGSWLVVRSLESGGQPKLSISNIVALCAAVSAILTVFIFVAASRTGGISNSSPEVLMRTLGLYAGGAIPAYSAWFPHAGEPQFGLQTFAGITQFIPGQEGIGSAYVDFTDIGGGLSTNVYTALRLLSEDFTVPGMLLIIGFSTLLAAEGFRRAVSYGSLNGALGYATWSGFILFSQTTSIYSFTNVTFGVLLGCILVKTLTKTRTVMSQDFGNSSASAHR